MHLHKRGRATSRPVRFAGGEIKVCTAEQKTEVFEARVSGDAGIEFHARIIFVFLLLLA